MTPLPHPFLRRLAITASLVMAAGAAFAQAPIVIKFSHVVASDTPKGQAADLFKKLAEERTRGRVKVEVYPNSQLYKDKEEMEALQLGSVQMLAPSLAKFAPLGVKEFEVFDLPFIMPNEDSFAKVTASPVAAKLLAKLEAKGVKGLAFWDNGPHIMSSNKPMHVPADFRGMKMRIQSSKVLDAQMRALGALPQVMAFSELYQGLQTGVVDGTEGVPSNFWTQKIHEVQKHMTISNHGHLAYAVIVDKKFWDGLPDDIRKTLEGAMREATEFENRIAKKDNAQALENIRKSGKTTVYTLTPDERKEWIKVLLPLHAEMQSRLGGDLIAEFYKYSGFTAGGR